jgi:hypothetical protein
MSDPRAIKTIFINEEMFARGLLSGTTWQSAQPLSFYRGSQSLIRAHIMLNDGITYFCPPIGATWLAGFDNEFTGDHADLVVSLNDKFVAADWSGSDFYNGKLCWRMDWTTQALKGALGDNPSISGWICLWMFPIGESPVLIAQFPAVVNNVAVDPTTATAVEGITYPTTDVLIAAIRNITDPVGGLYRIRNGAVQLKNVTTGKFQTNTNSGAAGAETTDYGPQED